MKRASAHARTRMHTNTRTHTAARKQVTETTVNLQWIASAQQLGCAACDVESDVTQRRSVQTASYGFNEAR